MAALFFFRAIASFAYDGEERYETRGLEGWTLRVHRDLIEREPKLAEETLRLLQQQLYQITRVVPAKALAELRAIPIWIELAHPRHPCMCYHISPDWLRAHDMNPAKAGSVEIANCKNFLLWTKDQPWMVLHELAHAYHDKVLRHGHPELKSAFRKAVESKKYEQVLHINGKTVRHYALNNDQEYFAEGTEAYFGTNDFYPFVRAELKAHDPELFELLGKLWNLPEKHSAIGRAP
ncbi:MAG: hypothetical protein AB1813_04470 [Verrucomicrobiota bacterium]